MNRTILRLSLTAVLVVSTAGCGDVDDQQPNHQNAADDLGDPDCEDCGGWDVDDPIDRGPTTPCQPEALAYDYDHPEIPDSVSASTCPLEATVVEYQSDDQPDRLTSWTRDGQTIEMTTTEGELVVETLDFEFGDDPQDVRFVERQLHHRADSWTDYGRLETDRWDFDDRGRLVERTYRRVRTDNDETLDYESVEQTWEDDRLVERIELEGVDDVERDEFSWDYDESGRLTGATYLEDDELVGQTDWNYDQDRPAKVERRVDGEVVETQSWSYRDDGTLSGRELESSGTDSPTPLDNYVLTEAGRGPSLWRPDEDLTSANAHRRAAPSDSCYELPHSSGHGYPVDEPAYIVGLEPGDPLPFDPPGHISAPAEAPSIAGHYSRPGYAHPPRLHYGHVGLSTGWPEGRNLSNKNIELVYDETGRMVTERLERQQHDDQLLEVERQRDFSDGTLQRDHIDLQMGDQTAGATLDFDDGDDRRVRRRIRDGREVADQTWRFADGRAVELDIRVPDHIEAAVEWGDRPLTALFNTPEEDSDANGQPQHTATYQRQFDDQGRLTDAVQTTHHSDLGADGTTVETSIDRGEDGPIEWTQTSMAEDGETTVERRAGWTYDDDGHLLVEWLETSSDDGFDETHRAYTRDDEGRIVEVFDDEHTESRTTTSTTRVLACRQ